MRLPDYHGGGIVNLMASLQQGMGGQAGAYPELSMLPAGRIAEFSRVMLLVIDGLGDLWLRRHPKARWLNRHRCGSMTSVFPPTTATAVTTYLTGDAPRQHGITGWFVRFEEFQQVFAVLPGHPRGSGTTLTARAGDLSTFLGHRAFTDGIAVPSHIVSPANIADSPYNLVHLGAARLHTYLNVNELVDTCAELLSAPGERYVYAYWSGLDTVGHAYGIGSKVAARHLYELDKAVARLARWLRGSQTLLLVTADHGQIDVDREQQLNLTQFPSLVETLDGPLSGEPRCAYCHVRSGQRDRFPTLVRDYLGDVVQIFEGRRLIEEGWYGIGESHPGLADRVGDFVLLLKAGYVLYDSVPGEGPFTQIGVHGGLSEWELEVPLVLAEC